MIDIEKYFNLSPQLVREIRSLKYDSNATYKFEHTSGGLIWSDEINQPIMLMLLQSENYLYRFLLAYRASLISGSENTEIRPLWEKMSELFPDWPGFRKERCHERLKEVLYKNRNTSKKEIIQVLKQCKKGE